MPKGSKLAFTSPEGRLVQGDAFTPNDKDKTGAPRVVKSGPNAGQPSPQWILVVAFAKNDPAWLAFEQMIKGKAAEDFPQFFAAGPLQPPSHPNFSFKIQDGDGFDGDGKPNNVKEGHAGHWVVKFSSGFAPKVFNKGHYAPQEQVFKLPNQPAPGPRRGDFVRISGTIEGNDDVARPAVYVNVSLVEFSRPGIEIVSGPSAEAAFGGSAGTVAIPPPASPAPAPAAPAGLVAATGIDLAAYRASGWTDDQLVAAGHATRPALVTPPPAPPAAPAAASPPPPPYTGYMAPPPPAPAAPVRQMTAAAQGLTYEQYIASGWDDAMLIQHGMMIPNA